MRQFGFGFLTISICLLLAACGSASEASEKPPSPEASPPTPTSISQPSPESTLGTGLLDCGGTALMPYPTGWTVSAAEDGQGVTPPGLQDNMVRIRCGQFINRPQSCTLTVLEEWVDCYVESVLKRDARISGIGIGPNLPTPLGKAWEVGYILTFDDSEKMVTKWFFKVTRPDGTPILGVVAFEVLPELYPEYSSTFRQMTQALRPH